MTPINKLLDDLNAALEYEAASWPRGTTLVDAVLDVAREHRADIAAIAEGGEAPQVARALVRRLAGYIDPGSGSDPRLVAREVAAILARHSEAVADLP